MITIQPLKRKWKIKKIESDSSLTDKQKKAVYSSVVKLYIKLYKEAIKKQLYRWKPLSKPYLQYKKKKKLNLGIWIATGNLHKSLTSKKLVIGYFNKRVDGIPLNSIARLLEYGNPIKNLPPRPLFKKIKSEITKKHLDDIITEVKEKTNDT